MDINKKIVMKFLLILLFITTTVYSQEQTDTLFNDVWVHSGKSSAVVFWQHFNIESACQSYVEYGFTTDYGYQTDVTQQGRRAQFHRITGLETNQEYHFRMVMIDDGTEYISEDRTFTTKLYNDVVEIGQSNDNSTIVLNQANTTYILTEDIESDGNAIEISADNITLELDGHTINYSQNTVEDYINGILINNPNVKIYNGKVVQGSTGGNYSYAVGARWRADGVELSGLSIDVNRPNAYPIALAGSAKKHY